MHPALQNTFFPLFPCWLLIETFSSVVCRVFANLKTLNEYKTQNPLSKKSSSIIFYLWLYVYKKQDCHTSLRWVNVSPALGSWSVCWDRKKICNCFKLIPLAVTLFGRLWQTNSEANLKISRTLPPFPLTLTGPICPHLTLEPWAASSMWRACVASVLSNVSACTTVRARQCVHTGRGSAALQLRQLLFVQCSATRSSINSPFCGSNWITANRGKQIQIKTKVYPSSPLYLPSFVARLYKCCNINRNIQQGEYQWCHIGAALPEGTFQLQYWTCAVSVVILTVVKSLLGKVCCWFVVWWADSYCALFPYR